MSTENDLRTYMVGLHLRENEYRLIDQDARNQRITRSEALRRACPKYFAEAEVKKGRRAGISPWKLER